MKQIKASEIRENMILWISDHEQVVVNEVWENQGQGLGIMVKGKTVYDVFDWERRFIDPDEYVAQVTPAVQSE